MRRKLFFCFVMILVSLFAINLFESNQISASNVTYNVTTGIEKSNEADGGVINLTKIADSEILEIKYDKAPITINNTNCIINIKGKVTNIYRIKVFVHYSDDTRIEISRLFDTTSSKGLTTLDSSTGDFLYRGNFGLSWIGKTIVKIRFQFYLVDRTKERIGELELYGVGFDSNGSYNDFADSEKEDDKPIEIPEGDVIVSDFVTEADAIITKANNEQIISYNTSPGWNGFHVQVDNYNKELNLLKFSFTPSKDISIFYVFNSVEDWDIGYQTYEGGRRHTVTIDLSNKNLPSSFDLMLLLDAQVAVTWQQTLTIHTLSFYNNSKEYQTLVKEYHNDGVYTKKSNIYLSGDAESEIAQFFHGNVDKNRTTYYNGEYLLMGNFDGTFAALDNKNNPINGINSGYRTEGNDVKHFVFRNGNVVDTYTVKNTSLHEMYVTLNKMIQTDYFDETWDSGVHEVSDINDTYLQDFLAFAAPCLTDLVLKSNYISANGIKLTINEGRNVLGNYLSFKIYVSPENAGIVENGELLSEARIYKGNESFDETSIEEFVVTYTESIETFSNPDIGFYEPSQISAALDGINNVNSKLLYRNSLIHLRIDLSIFSSKVNGNKDIEITPEVLEALDNMFKQIDEAEACAIVRFAYDQKYNGNTDQEPSMNMILRHIEQFTPILNKYKHLITAVECGLVGPWGEMHSSNYDDQASLKQIFDKYLSCLDTDIAFLVRRPRFIYEYYGYTLDTLDQFDYNNNRIGCYNDGYLGSSTDLSTFKDRDKEIAFLEKINATNPYGGEVVAKRSSDSDPIEYNQLSWACSEMFRTNLTYLNLHWNDTVIARWQNTDYTLDDPLYKGQSEFTYIKNHLGYRFVCEELHYTITNKLYFNLQMKNVGFGELFKSKKSFVILKNKQNQYVFEFEYNNELLIQQSFDLSEVIKGDYELYFVLADSFTTSAIRGIRFANINMYNEELNANKMTNISIK